MPQILFFAVVGVSMILNVVGLIVNLFIVVVNYKMWLKSHRNSSSDRILFSVGITRFLLLGLFLLYIICLFISPDIERSVCIPTSFLSCWMFLDLSGLWFVTLLNIFYCVKITNFQHPVFLLLKRNLSPKLPGLLLACVLASAITTLLYVVLVQALSSPEAFGPRGNGTVFDITERVLPSVIILVLISFLLFIINVTSACLLIHSLRRHIQKMQRNASGFWDPQTEAHVGAMKLMVYFLLFYVPYSVTTLLRNLPVSVGMDLGTRSMYMIISNCYPAGHSLLIVLTHLKLKTKAKKFLCCNQ